LELNLDNIVQYFLIRLGIVKEALRAVMSQKITEDDLCPFIIGINGSLTEHGDSARNLKRVLQYIEHYGGRTKLIYLLDPQFNIFPKADYKVSKTNTCWQDYPYVDENTKRLFGSLFEAQGFILSTSVHWGEPASPTEALLEKLDILENAGCLLEGKVAGIIINFGFEEGGVGARLAAAFLKMGLVIPPYGIVCCSAVSRAFWLSLLPIMLSFFRENSMGLRVDLRRSQKIY